MKLFLFFAIACCFIASVISAPNYARPKDTCSLIEEFQVEETCSPDDDPAFHPFDL